MESLINIKFRMDWNHPGVVTFYGPEYELDVLEKGQNYFVLKQTKKISPQDVGLEGYDVINRVKFVKENEEWKFAGAEEQK